jgi:hypothetical protein
MRLEDIRQRTRDRRKVLAAARKGLPAADSKNYRDAFATFTSIELVLDAFDREKGRPDNVGYFFTALSNAWNGRKSWRV